MGTVDVPGASAYVANTPTPTNWREELLRIDHNINTKNRVTFRYIHDSWNYIEPTPIWSNANFPTTRTFFDGPGISMLARLTSNISPTLLNEFVVSYTADHISFKTQGYWQRPADFSTQMGSIFNNGGGGKLPAVSLSGGIYDRVAQDPDGAWPEGLYNSNPTYTYRDNVTKIVGRHNLQFGAYFVAAQKNELSQLQLNGALTFDTGSKVSSGNAFADLLLGNIGSFSQGSNQVKFYNRYKIFEPVSYAGVGVMSPAVNLGVAGCGVIADYFRPFHGVSTITRLENMASSTYHALQVSARRSVGALSLSAVYTYSHAIDDGSDRYDTAFVNSYNVAANRASSSFDQRHIFNLGYVYDLPFFSKRTGALRTALGGWEWSGMVGYQTGTPFTVTNGTTFGDNAGVGNAVGTGSYADVIGNPKANIPPPSQVTLSSDAFFFYNPGAFTAPTGLTFGNAGRNSLRNPNRTNFDRPCLSISR